MLLVASVYTLVLVYCAVIAPGCAIGSCPCASHPCVAGDKGCSLRPYMYNIGRQFSCDRLLTSRYSANAGTAKQSFHASQPLQQQQRRRQPIGRQHQPQLQPLTSQALIGSSQRTRAEARLHAPRLHSGKSNGSGSAHHAATSGSLLQRYAAILTRLLHRRSLQQLAAFDAVATTGLSSPLAVNSLGNFAPDLGSLGTLTGGGAGGVAGLGSGAWTSTMGSYGVVKDPNALFGRLNGIGNTAWTTTGNAGATAGSGLSQVDITLTQVGSTVVNGYPAAADLAKAVKFSDAGDALAVAAAPAVNNAQNTATGLTQSLAPAAQDLHQDATALTVQAVNTAPAAAASLAGAAGTVATTVQPSVSAEVDQLSNAAQLTARAAQQVGETTVAPLAAGTIGFTRIEGAHMGTAFKDGFKEGFRASMDRRAPYADVNSQLSKYRAQPALYLPQSFYPLGSVANITYPCPSSAVGNQQAPTGTLIGPGIPCGVVLQVVPRSAVPTNALARPMVVPIPSVQLRPPPVVPGPIPIPTTPLPPITPPIVRPPGDAAPPGTPGITTPAPPIIPPVLRPPGDTTTTPGAAVTPAAPPTGPGASASPAPAIPPVTGTTGGTTGPILTPPTTGVPGVPSPPGTVGTPAPPPAGTIPALPSPTPIPIILPLITQSPTPNTQS